MSRNYKNSTIILMGRRSSAIKTATRLGFSIILLDDSDTPLKNSTSFLQFTQVNFRWKKPTWSRIAQKIKDQHTPIAVVATVERAVKAAAELRNLLEISGLSVETAIRCTDKQAMKRHIQNAKIPTARFASISKLSMVEHMIDEVGFPLVLKRASGSGSRGTRIINAVKELPENFRDGWMAEEFISGTECSVESMVVEGKIIFTNQTRYFEPKWVNIVPAGWPPLLARQIEAFNREVIEALGIQRAMTHLEIFIQPDGLVFGEIAVRPPGGHIMELIEHSHGFSPWELWLRIECGESPEPPINTPIIFCAVRIIHPGRGIVNQVEGEPDIHKLPGLIRFKNSCKPGKLIGRRLSVGGETGYIIASDKDCLSLQDTMRKSKRLLKIEVEKQPKS